MAMIEPSASRGNVRDRLVTALFVVVIFHGIVILGVTFAPLIPRDQPYQPSLQVALLINPGDDLEQREAEYQAQSSQRGSGNSADSKTPAIPLPASNQRPQQGLPTETGSALSDPGQTSNQPEVLASRASDATKVQAIPNPTEQPDIQRQRPSDQRKSDDNVDIVAEIEKDLSLRGQRELLITADTTASDVAVYLSSWKTKIEKIGTQNYSGRLRTQDARNPTLEVVVQSDGLLREIIVVRSSGQRNIDEAALATLRLAAPFDPFPEELRKKYDVVRFAYEWQFITGR